MAGRSRQDAQRGPALSEPPDALRRPEGDAPTKLVVGAAQFDVTRSRDENLATIERIVGDAEVDLLVLPELCTTGYLFADRASARAAAEPLDGSTVETLVRISRTSGTTLVAGIAEADGESLFNTTVVAARGAVLGTQRKAHLSRLEQQIFDPGGPPEVIDVGAATIGCLSCFDLWLPERARLLTRAGAQLLCSPSAFGAPTTLAIARTRAIENHAWVLVANRTGYEQGGDVHAAFRGESAIFDPGGASLASLQEDTGSCRSRIDPAASDRKRTAMFDDLADHYLRYEVAYRFPVTE